MIKNGMGHMQGHIHYATPNKIHTFGGYATFLSVQCSVLHHHFRKWILSHYENRKHRKKYSSWTFVTPSDRQGFLLHSGNKADLANFLSQQLVQHAPETIRGFTKVSQIDCNNCLNLTTLQGKNEEVNTHVILHCSHGKCVSQRH